MTTVSSLGTKPQQPYPSSCLAPPLRGVLRSPCTVRTGCPVTLRLSNGSSRRRPPGSQLRRREHRRRNYFRTIPYTAPPCMTATSISAVPTGVGEVVVLRDVGSGSFTSHCMVTPVAPDRALETYPVPAGSLCSVHHSCLCRSIRYCSWCVGSGLGCSVRFCGSRFFLGSGSVGCTTRKKTAAHECSRATASEIRPSVHTSIVLRSLPFDAHPI